MGPSYIASTSLTSAMSYLCRLTSIVLHNTTNHVQYTQFRLSSGSPTDSFVQRRVNRESIYLLFFFLFSFLSLRRERSFVRFFGNLAHVRERRTRVNFRGGFSSVACDAILLCLRPHDCRHRLSSILSLSLSPSFRSRRTPSLLPRPSLLS